MLFDCDVHSSPKLIESDILIEFNFSTTSTTSTVPIFCGEAVDRLLLLQFDGTMFSTLDCIVSIVKSDDSLPKSAVSRHLFRENEGLEAVFILSCSLAGTIRSRHYSKINDKKAKSVPCDDIFRNVISRDRSEFLKSLNIARISTKDFDTTRSSSTLQITSPILTRSIKNSLFHRKFVLGIFKPSMKSVPK